MKLDDRYLRFAMASTTGVVLCLVAAEVIAPDRPDLKATLAVFKEWQGLLAGAFTLVAAGFAANYVVAQMRHAQSLEDARVARARRAWLAMMPEAMSAVCGYATKSYLGLVDQHAVATQPSGLTSANNPAREVPRLDEKIFPEIRSMIENAGGPAEADAYAEVLSQIQVHRVRWRGRLDQLSTPHDNVLAATLETEMVYAAELYARASNLLGAARPNKTPEDLKPVTRVQALRLLGGNRHAVAAVEKMAERWDEARPLTVP